MTSKDGGDGSGQNDPRQGQSPQHLEPPETRPEFETPTPSPRAATLRIFGALQGDAEQLSLESARLSDAEKLKAFRERLARLRWKRFYCYESPDQRRERIEDLRRENAERARRPRRSIGRFNADGTFTPNDFKPGPLVEPGEPASDPSTEAVLAYEREDSRQSMQAHAEMWNDFTLPLAQSARDVAEIAQSRKRKANEVREADELAQALSKSPLSPPSEETMGLAESVSLLVDQLAREATETEELPPGEALDDNALSEESNKPSNSQAGGATEDTAKTTPEDGLKVPDGADPDEEAVPDANRFAKGRKTWSITYHRESAELGHLVGLDYIGYLIGHTGQEFGAATLRLAANTASARLESVSEGAAFDDSLFEVHRSEQSVLEPEESLQVATAIRNLKDDLVEARKGSDPVRTAQLEREIATLCDLYRQGHYRGRTKQFDDEDESHRRAVCRGIERAIEAVRGELPALADHLRAHLKLGKKCSYNPPTPETWMTA